MTDALAQRDRFDFRVELSPEELWERIVAHPRVREANDPAPDPPPPQGEPFLVARASRHEIRIRHWAGPADASCPVVVLELEQDGGRTIVHGRFRARRRQGALVPNGEYTGPKRSPWAYATVATIVLGIAMAAPVIIGVAPIHLLSVLMLLLIFTVPTVLVFVPALMIWNGEVRRGFVGPMWELLGEVFTPIALPEAESDDTPFRHALPAADQAL